MQINCLPGCAIAQETARPIDPGMFREFDAGEKIDSVQRAVEQGHKAHIAQLAPREAMFLAHDQQ